MKDRRRKNRIRVIRWYHRLWMRLVLMQHPNYRTFKKDLRGIWSGR